MLQACLNSLARLIVGPDLSLCIIVVDNEAGANNRELVESYDETAPIPVYYVHQPVRGIARARNAAVEKAMGIAVDWIAFIDDDEVAGADWIARLMAQEYRDTPILAGKQVMVFPEKLPFWCVPPQAERPEGQERLNAFTHNVRFSADVLREGLRFNDSLGLMGGEDCEFFASARKAGFSIRSTERAVTYETAHPERLTYRGFVSRQYWCAIANLRQRAIEQGWPRTILSKLWTVPWYVTYGLVEVAVSPLFLFFGVIAFKRRALEGGAKVAKGLGRAAAMLGHMPQPYRSVVGH